MSDYLAKINRLAKWRGHFAGWQLGTRATNDVESQAVRDHREVTILLRAEVSALAGLLLEKGVFTQKELQDAIGREADLLAMSYEARWPGAHAGDDGMHYNVERAMVWMQHWRP